MSENWKEKKRLKCTRGIVFTREYSQMNRDFLLFVIVFPVLASTPLHQISGHARNGTGACLRLVELVLFQER